MNVLTIVAMLSAAFFVLFMGVILLRMRWAFLDRRGRPLSTSTGRVVLITELWGDRPSSNDWPVFGEQLVLFGHTMTVRFPDDDKEADFYVEGAALTFSLGDTVRCQYIDGHSGIRYPRAIEPITPPLTTDT